MDTSSRSRGARVARWLLVLLTWCAFAIRLWHLDAVPPGWSDDELSNIFVISQKIFQGDFAVYYPDATGLEALYHVVAGLLLRLFGFNAIGIRLLSVLLGTVTVPLTYQAGRRLFGRWQGVVAAAALTVSFWSLIYSRVNLRHISLPVFMLLAFTFFWQGLSDDRGARQQARRAFLLSGLFMGIGFYTYFAARGVPLILLGFLVYLALFYREPLRHHGRELLLPFGVALFLAIPLLLTLWQLTGADARVAEVAVPLVEARAGNFEPLQRHLRVTLSMFHADGDDEFLYNIPHRPVFGPVGAAFLWSGVLLAVVYALRPLWPRGAYRHKRDRRRAAAAAFLLLWWIAGITPGFLSVPPASLGHTIVAQPATYLLAALPVAILAGRGQQRARRSLLAAGVALLFILSVAARDLPDYFQAWPSRGNVRFLYHADLKNVAAYLARHPEMTDFAITGLLAGPWDQLALEVELANAGVSDAKPRWYDPRRAIFIALNEDSPPLAFYGYPLVAVAYEGWYQPLAASGVGGYRLARIEAPEPPPFPQTCFVNGLCLIAAEYEAGPGRLHLTWQVEAPLTLPAREILSKPPPPGSPSEPRLLVFSQLLDEDGTRLTGDDGLWVDPYGLEVGDSFRQQHILAPPAEQQATATIVGLYDPRTGERIPTIDGRDHLRLELHQSAAPN